MEIHVGLQLGFLLRSDREYTLTTGKTVELLLGEHGQGVLKQQRVEVQLQIPQYPAKQKWTKLYIYGMNEVARLKCQLTPIWVLLEIPFPDDETNWHRKGQNLREQLNSLGSLLPRAKQSEKYTQTNGERLYLQTSKSNFARTKLQENSASLTKEAGCAPT